MKVDEFVEIVRRSQEVKLLIEIDGEPFEYTDFYPLEDCVGGVELGYLVGRNEKTAPTDKVRGFEVGGLLGVVNAYNRHKSGHIVGIQGIFRRAEWVRGPDDKTPLFRVSDRLA